MKKLKNITIMFALLILVIFCSNFVYAKFLDVLENNPYFQAIEYVRKMNIVNGYRDGTYKPDQLINRAEFTKILLEAVFDETFLGGNCFPDIGTEWFASYVCTAKNKNIINGYPDGFFKPSQNISFAEAAKIISKSLQFQTQPHDIWFIPYVESIKSKDAMPESILDVGQKITRGEMAEIIYRLKDYLPAPQNQLPLINPPEIDPEEIKTETRNFVASQEFHPPFIPAPSSGTQSCVWGQNLIIPPNTCESTIDSPPYCNGDSGKLVFDCRLCGCSQYFKTCNQLTGQCDTQWCNGEICGESQTCSNNRCILKEQKYKIGMFYLYYDKFTYNPKWRDNLFAIRPKIVKGLKEITQGKISPSIDIVGGVKIDNNCWNPAELGWIENKTLGYKYYVPNPGSSFDSLSIVLSDEGEVAYFEKCPFCETSIDSESSQRSINISCKNPLRFASGNASETFLQLQEEIEQKLGVYFSYYDQVILVFGKMGKILESDPNYLSYKCQGIISNIEGYASIVIGENSLMESSLENPYLFNCQGINGAFYSNTSFYGYYEKVGWHTIIHEILHHFGAKDFYDPLVLSIPGFTDIDLIRTEALKKDPDLERSVMASETGFKCMDFRNGSWGEFDGKNFCSFEELESLYLDKINKEKIGLE